MGGPRDPRRAPDPPAGSDLPDLRAIGALFDIPGEFADGAPHGSGHIHETFVATWREGGREEEGEDDVSPISDHEQTLLRDALRCRPEHSHIRPCEIIAVNAFYISW